MFAAATSLPLLDDSTLDTRSLAVRSLFEHARSVFVDLDELISEYLGSVMPSAADDGTGFLAWLRDDYGLTDEQWAVVSSDSSPSPATDPSFATDGAGPRFESPWPCCAS